MKIVANSSVLIALSSIGRLDLLKQRFNEDILIPDAVWNEVVVTGKGRPGAEIVRKTAWLKRCMVKDTDYVRLLCADLDAGEAEAIVLARELKADVILLDEKTARSIADRLGLYVLGTVGLLLWARQRNLIPSLREQLDTLRHKGCFRLSQDLYRAVLAEVGES
ncbi:MAG: DUF3368 domain-containing protein [Anaerolineae bacterium]